MKYGYFDGANKEYVITQPNTPAPWANYLGSPDYGAIISNNAGGYSFVKSGANGRIIRYRFNSTPADQPGRYIYIHDKEDADYWSASWQPVGKDLDEYKSECRHGTAYTVMKSAYKDIETETLYYVPLDKTYEVWRLKVTNQGSKPRKLALFGYVEFTNDANYEQDSVNLQYTQFISKTYFRENMMLQAINEHVSEVGGGASGLSDEAGEGIWRFFGVQGAAVSRYDGDRDIFVGDYRGYRNPSSVEQGACTNTLNYNGNSCGALQIDVDLAPGESKEMVFLLGAYGEADAREILGRYADLNVVEDDLQELKDYWHSKLSRFQVNTPDENFNHMVNVWNAYQCFITFIWSRAASFQYCGLRNGLGYRDTVQDIQGIMHLEPVLARERLTLMLSAQVSNGGGLPLVKFNHRPGHEGTPDDPVYAQETGHPFYRADDALWLFPTTIRYLKESGDWAYVDEVIPFSDQGEGTVYEHLRRAIQFSIDRLGEHGMPVGLHADWNDALRLGARGESLFVAFQLYLALGIYMEVAAHKQDEAERRWAEALRTALGDNIQKHAWEGDRFVRGFTEDGYVVGSRDNEEANLWLNPQTWSILSGFATTEQAHTAMDLVYEKLNTEYGAMLFYPPFKKFGLPVARMALFNGTTKENAGIFSQPQGWVILAETMLGRGDRAYAYFSEINPATMNDKAEIRKIEPYVHGQSIEGIDSPFYGRGHVHWLTGTASTVMVSLTEGIMGVQPEFDGLRLDPCIPSAWREFTMYREFRGKRLHIKVVNPNGVEKGVAKLILNGDELEGNVLPANSLLEENEILVELG